MRSARSWLVKVWTDAITTAAAQLGYPAVKDELREAEKELL